jgi:hypothetical protein
VVFRGFRSAGVIPIALLAFALSGCAMVGSTSSLGLAAVAVGQQAAGFSPASNAPTVGSCWQESDAQLYEGGTWVGNPVVDCSSQHEAYTFAVPTLDGGYPASWAATAPSPPEVRTDVNLDARSACSSAEKKVLPNVTELQALIQPSYFLPSLSQWAEGARWVRCDLSLMQIGSAYNSPALAPLPDIASLRSMAANSPEQFDVCINQPGSNSNEEPFATNAAVYAPCSGSVQWKLVVRTEAPYARGVAYPFGNAMYAYAHSVCGAKFDTSTQRTWLYYPSSASWPYGDRTVSCWLTRITGS